MRLLHPITEDEMIAAFLRGELDSGRYGKKLRDFLRRDACDPVILRRPDTTDPDANRYRRRLLDEHRAYDRRVGLFLGFPLQVEWFRAALEPEEVLDILFIDWDWWLKLSGGSRQPRDAAQRIRNGDLPGQTAAEDEPIAAALASAAQPPLIAVTTSSCSPIVLVEGHVRLTAYALFPDYLPDELEILLGISDEMSSWCQF